VSIRDHLERLTSVVIRCVQMCLDGFVDVDC